MGLHPSKNPIQYILKTPQSHPKLPNSQTLLAWDGQTNDDKFEYWRCRSSSKKSANNSLKFVNIVPWFCDIRNTRAGKNVQIRMHQRDSELLPKKLRQGATGLTTNGQTLQKACNIDYCGTSSEVDDVNRRTDPCKDLHNVEQTQKPAPAVTNQVRGNTSPRHVPPPWPA